MSGETLYQFGEPPGPYFRVEESEGGGVIVTAQDYDDEVGALGTSIVLGEWERENLKEAL